MVTASLPFSNERLQYHSFDILMVLQPQAFILVANPMQLFMLRHLPNQMNAWIEQNKMLDVKCNRHPFLLDAIKQLNTYCIYLSTDFVFDGQKDYTLKRDTTEPVNYYGSSKLAAEKAVIESMVPTSLLQELRSVYGNALPGEAAAILLHGLKKIYSRAKIKVVNTTSCAHPLTWKILQKEFYYCWRKSPRHISYFRGRDDDTVWHGTWLLRIICN